MKKPAEARRASIVFILAAMLLCATSVLRVSSASEGKDLTPAPAIQAGSSALRGDSVSVVPGDSSFAAPENPSPAEARSNTVEYRQGSPLAFVKVVPYSGKESDPLEQGGAFMVVVTDASGLLASARASWDGRVIPCLPARDTAEWTGYGAAARLMEPGIYELGLSLETTMGDRVETAIKVEVKARDYLKAELAVDPKYAAVPEEKKADYEADVAAFASAYGSPLLGRMDAGPSIRPLPGRVTSPFGVQRLLNKKYERVHLGVDLAGPVGEPIKAMLAGRVVLAREAYIHGATVIVDHGGGVMSLYCHLSAFKKAPGDFVERGETVGLCGATGRVTGPHLHWGLKIQNEDVDALTMFNLQANAEK